MTGIASGAAPVRARKSAKRKLLDIGIVGLLGTGVFAAASAAQAGNAGISKVVILSSGSAFGGCSIGSVGTFTVIKGYALDLIDPGDPHNTDITDIALAPRDANGYVNLLLNFYMTVPSNLANGNGKIVADIPNRGNVEIASPNRSAGGNTYGSSSVNCNGITSTGTFWWPQGYSIVDAGWEYAGDPTSAANTSLSASGVVLPVANPPVATTTMPIAMNTGNTPITGPGYEYIVETGPTSATNGTGTTTYVLGGVSTPSYPATPLGGANSCSGNGVLTHRQHLDDTPVVLNPSDWQYNIGSDGNCDSISLLPNGSGPSPYYSACTASTGGNVATGACFIGQDIYELSYTAANPTVNGLGVIAIRDFYSWLKGNSGTASQSLNPFSAGYIKEVYSWTVSQPARTLNDFLHLGMNEDLSGQRVFDGMLNWIGAGDGLSMNYRWSQTSRTQRNRQHLLYDEGIFPFADVTTTDPISGTTDGRYARCTASNTCPLMNLELYSANEYWVKTASLFTTDPTGSSDLPDHPLSRKYYMSSLQHGGGTQNSKSSTGVCQNYNNPIDAEYVERALWTDLDKYITQGMPLPASQIPTLAGGTLVSPLDLKFPNGYMQTVTGINGGSPFPVLYTGLETTRYRLDYGPNFYQSFVPTYNPPLVYPPMENNGQNGAIYPSYVPQINADGNDVSGLMMPEVQVPLATYAGWNLRSGSSNAPTPQYDGPDGCESTGSYIQFAATSSIANANGDPRPSITSRYPTYADYLNKVVGAVNKLVTEHLMLCGPDIDGPLSMTGGGGELANLVQDWTSISGLPSTNGLQPPGRVSACSQPHDFNGDGIGDVLWRDTSGNLAMWLMSAGKMSSGATISQVPTNWSVVGTRDFNGDGNADILWQDQSGDLGLWEMNGTSVSAQISLGNVGTSWTVMGTGDFDGDGTGDILWRDSSGDLAIWLMSNGQLSSGVSLGQASSDWSIAGTGDFNGDGTTDILWRNQSTGDLAIWFINNGQFSSSVDLGVVSPSWTVVGTGDFNGDGTSDILWRDSSGNLAIWLMSNGQLSSGATVSQVPTTWSVAETGDFDGDGKSDILWTDQSGDVAVWLMNGTSLSSGIGLGNVGTTWQVQGQNAD